MKSWSRLLCSGLLTVLLAAAVSAQQPIVSVNITRVGVVDGPGPVADIAVVEGGNGYTSAPAVAINGGGGSGATAVATISNGAVVGITVTSGGSGYTGTPTVSLLGGGGSGATALATVDFNTIDSVSPNESSGPALTPIEIEALAVGTFVRESFTYSFFVNGVSIGKTTEPVPPPIPAVVMWTPPQPGSYFLTVTATDSVNTATSLAVRYFATGTVVNSPLNGTLVPQGSSIVLKADATVAGGFIKQIQFYDNGVAIGSPDTTLPYSLIYTPSGPAGTVHNITAQATDNNDTQVPLSAPVAITVINPIAPVPSSVISSPTHNAGIAIPTDSSANIAVTVDAASPTGRVTKVELYIDGELFGTDNTFPYSFEWHPTVVGTYRLVALTYDDKNNVIASTTNATTTSTPEPTVVRVAAPPTVTVISPTNGATVAGGVAVQLTANASDSNPGGTISSVQFFVDGVFVGVATTPTSGGLYSVTTTLSPKIENGEIVPTVIRAMAISGLDISAISAGISVTVTDGGSDNGDGPDDPDDDDGSGGGSVSDETFYSGSYQSTTETGRVMLADLGNNRAIFIGYTSGPNPKVYFYSGVEVDNTGAFSLSSNGAVSVSGSFSDTGAMGSFDSGRLNFIVPVSMSNNTGLAPAGVYSGNIVGRLSSALTVIVTPDGGIAAYVADGTYQDAGSGSLASGGTFNLTLVSGARLAGSINPASGFLSATLSGGTVSGAAAAALTTGGEASDGTLRNLSTRGLVGSGENVLIAGFVVTGTAPKQVLIRALGPTLIPQGVSGVVSDPRIDLYNSSSVVIASNDNWGADAAIASVSSQLGAAPLASAESAILTTLQPGLYTTFVSSVNGATGVGLVEVWDADAAVEFAEDKVVNVSTRGRVEPGERILIAGFVVNGTTPKRVLVRAVGPGLSPLGVSGVLADPVLRIMKGSELVRENDNWETGNDASLVTAVTSAVGAQPPLAAGSKDSAILITLPPGLYTAQVSIGSGSAGVALVEVYEVP